MVFGFFNKGNGTTEGKRYCLKYDSTLWKIFIVCICAFGDVVPVCNWRDIHRIFLRRFRHRFMRNRIFWKIREYFHWLTAWPIVKLSLKSCDGCFCLFRAPSVLYFPLVYLEPYLFYTAWASVWLNVGGTGRLVATYLCSYTQIVAF